MGTLYIYTLQEVSLDSTAKKYAKLVYKMSDKLRDRHIAPFIPLS